MSLLLLHTGAYFLFLSFSFRFLDISSSFAYLCVIPFPYVVFLFDLFISPLPKVRNLTPVTCAERALPLLATTTTTSGSHYNKILLLLLPLPHQKPQRGKAVSLWLLREDVHSKRESETSPQVPPFATCCQRVQHNQLVPSRALPPPEVVDHTLKNSTYLNA